MALACINRLMARSIMASRRSPMATSCLWRSSPTTSARRSSQRCLRAAQPAGDRFLRLGVALLVLFDAVNPGRLDGLSMMHAVLVRTDEFLRKIWFHLRSMTRLEFGELRAYFLERLWNFWHTLTRRTWAARVGTKVFPPSLRSELPNMYFVGQRYRPKPYTGR